MLAPGVARLLRTWEQRELFAAELRAAFKSLR